MRDRNNEFYRLFAAEGWTPREIACWHDVSERTVDKVIKVAIARDRAIPPDPKVEMPTGLPALAD